MSDSMTQVSKLLQRTALIPVFKGNENVSDTDNSIGFADWKQQMLTALNVDPEVEDFLTLEFDLEAKKPQQKDPTEAEELQEILATPEGQQESMRNAIAIHKLNWIAFYKTKAKYAECHLALMTKISTEGDAYKLVRTHCTDTNKKPIATLWQALDEKYSTVGTNSATILVEVFQKAIEGRGIISYIDDLRVKDQEFIRRTGHSLSEDVKKGSLLNALKRSKEEDFSRHLYFECLKGLDSKTFDELATEVATYEKNRQITEGDEENHARDGGYHRALMNRSNHEKRRGGGSGGRYFNQRGRGGHRDARSVGRDSYKENAQTPDNRKRNREDDGEDKPKFSGCWLCGGDHKKVNCPNWHKYQNG